MAYDMSGEILLFGGCMIHYQDHLGIILRFKYKCYLCILSQKKKNKKKKKKKKTFSTTF